MGLWKTTISSGFDNMRASFTVKVSREQETIALGEALGKTLSPGTIVALHGDLGAGKTVFTKGIAKGLETDEEPVSPTFVIMNEYSGRLPLYHFDLYRVGGVDELEGIGFEEYFYGDGVSVVEWAERAEELFGDDAVDVELRLAEGNNGNSHDAREITIRGKKDWLLSFKSTAERALRTSIK